MTGRGTISFRLSPEERRFLERHGRALADQLRRDLALVRAIEGAVRLGVADHLDLKGLAELAGISPDKEK